MSLPRTLSMDLGLEPAPMPVPVLPSGDSLMESQFDVLASLALSPLMSVALCFHSASLGDGGEITEILVQ